MKIGICGDIHWSQYSSIVRKQGKKYSMRLENLIDSVNWFNELTKEHQCMANFYMGDFFDKSELNASEISALSEIKWYQCSSYFLAGNHEMGMADHSYSSAKLFNLLDTGEMISRPTAIKLGGLEICLLPYILESDRKPLKEYFSQINSPRIILSHNDIKGIQMGKFISDMGFSMEEIEANCNRFINGHLHNGAKISEKIINIGNLTGQNFNEDASIYDHVAFILDTETLQIEVYENPYAFNFYKIDLGNTTARIIPKVKSNAVITFKCKEQYLNNLKEIIKTDPNIIESRITILPELNKETDGLEDIQELTVDHLETFKEYIISKFENSKELLEELSEVLR